MKKATLLAFFFLLGMLGLLFNPKGYANSDDLFADLIKAAEISREQHLATLPYHYNYNLMGGYFMTPSALPGSAGVVSGGFSLIPPYRNIAATIELFDRLECSINYKILLGIPDPTFGAMGYGSIADRGANVKLTLLKSTDGFGFLPDIAVGLEDFYGTRRFFSYYAVATKSFRKWPLEISGGWGAGRMGGFFAAARLMPFVKSEVPVFNQLSFIGEWDNTDYEDYPDEHPNGRYVSSRINMGISTKIADTMSINISSLRGEKIAASVSLDYNLGQSKGLLPKTGDPSVYATPINTEPLYALRSEQELAEELAFAFHESGLPIHKVYLTHEKKNKVLVLSIINLRFWNQYEVKKRVTTLVSRLFPSNFDSCRVVVEQAGVAAYQYQFEKRVLEKIIKHDIGAYELETLTPIKNPTPTPNLYDGVLLYSNNNDPWSCILRPQMISFFGSATGKFKYTLGVIGGPKGYLPGDIYYEVEGSFHAASTTSDLGTYDILNPSEMLGVRTDTLLYYQKHTFSLTKAYVQKGSFLGKGWYARAALGYFEPAYGGVCTELLYYPAGQHWALGLTGAFVGKRRYHGIGFTNKVRQYDGEKEHFVTYYGYQYFIDFYYDYKPLQIDIQVAVGQFLARDVGTKIEVGKYFPSGLRFYVWTDFTTAKDYVNGRLYHNKGIGFSFPLDIFMRKSSRNQFGYSMGVWLRDSGARSQTGKRLYPLLNQERIEL